MSLPIKIKKTALMPEAVAYELVKAHGRTVVSSIVDLTNNSGGVVGSAVNSANTSIAATAAAGSNLATSASVQAALQTVLDALNELFTKANAFATVLGLPNVSYNGGGAAPDGTIAVVTVSSTAAATGAPVAPVNAALASINGAFYELTALVNAIAKALGLSGLTNNQALAGVSGLAGQAISAITLTGITPDGAPGAAKADVDAALAVLAANVASAASVLNTFNNGIGNALVVIV